MYVCARVYLPLRRRTRWILSNLASVWQRRAVCLGRRSMEEERPRTRGRLYNYLLSYGGSDAVPTYFHRTSTVFRMCVLGITIETSGHPQQIRKGETKVLLTAYYEVKRILKLWLKL